MIGRVVALIALLAAGFAGWRFIGRAPASGPAVSAPHRKQALSGPQPTIALSLAKFQQDLQGAITAGRTFTHEQSHLFGLNHIEGFTEGDAGDTILFGRHDSTIPDIELDDLLVSLRNAYQVGNEYEGVPGVTIDPKPDVADPWRVQIARVLGMPPTAPMGVRQLKYDYDLKRVSAGLMKLKLKSDDVRGVFDLSRAQSSPCAAGGGSGKSATHRFWFTPLVDQTGPRYVAEGASVWIEKPVHVQLLSEEEFLQNGRRIGGAEPQPNAKQFAESITHVLARNEHEDYARLRNDFRIVEVGAVLRYREVDAGGLDYLLTHCPLRSLPAWGDVGGVRRTTVDEAVCEVRIAAGKVSGEVLGRSRHSYRGGVEAGVTVRAEDFLLVRDERLSKLRRRIIASRPSPESVAWSIPQGE